MVAAYFQWNSGVELVFTLEPDCNQPFSSLTCLLTLDSSNFIQPAELLELGQRLQTHPPQQRLTLDLRKNPWDRDRETWHDALRTLRPLCDFQTDGWKSRNTMADHISKMWNKTGGQICTPNMKDLFCRKTNQNGFSFFGDISMRMWGAKNLQLSHPPLAPFLKVSHDMPPGVVWLAVTSCFGKLPLMTSQVGVST